MTKEERLLRQEQRERAKAIEAAAREAGRGPLDLPYLLLVLTLVGVGLIMLFSASFPSAYYEEGNPAYYLIRQGIFAILGITAMFIVGKINYERYRAVAKMLLIFSIILLVLVLIPSCFQVTNEVTRRVFSKSKMQHKERRILSNASFFMLK